MSFLLAASSCACVITNAMANAADPTTERFTVTPLKLRELRLKGFGCIEYMNQFMRAEGSAS